MQGFGFGTLKPNSPFIEVCIRETQASGYKRNRGETVVCKCLELLVLLDKNVFWLGLDFSGAQCILQPVNSKPHWHLE